ncbi:rhodanese-like domain-containing protein [Aquirufa sp. ROCK2-A2]
MKKLLFILSVAFIISCDKDPQKGITELNPKDYQSQITSEEKSQLIDVRTPAEFQSGHIDGAQNLDIQALDFLEKAASLDKEKTVFVYCLSGGRSTAAAQQLATLGFQSVVNLKGGILAWNNAQLPLSTENSKMESKGMNLVAYKKMLSGKKSVIVDFHAEWCGPCKQLSPILEQYVKDQKGAVELIKIDVDQNQELAKELQIEAIPYVERYENGKLAWNKTGLFDINTLK